MVPDESAVVQRDVARATAIRTRVPADDAIGDRGGVAAKHAAAPQVARQDVLSSKHATAGQGKAIKHGVLVQEHAAHAASAYDRCFRPGLAAQDDRLAHVHAIRQPVAWNLAAGFLIVDARRNMDRVAIHRRVHRLLNVGRRRFPRGVGLGGSGIRPIDVPVRGEQGHLEANHG